MNEAEPKNDCGHQCFVIGGPFIAEDPACPVHGTAHEPTEAERVLLEERLLVIARRSIEHTVCTRCKGWGTIWYSSTALWRKGIGGQAFTPGVCDLCWGSGDEGRPWTDLRKLEAERDAVITARAASLLEETLGKSWTSAWIRNAQDALATLMEKEARRKKPPVGVDLMAYRTLTRLLGKLLRQFAERTS